MHNYDYYYNRLRPFVMDYPGEPLPEETFTHSLIPVINLRQLLPSTMTIASSLFNLCV